MITLAININLIMGISQKVLNKLLFETCAECLRYYNIMIMCNKFVELIVLKNSINLIKKIFSVTQRDQKIFSREPSIKSQNVFIQKQETIKTRLINPQHPKNTKNI